MSLRCITLLESMLSGSSVAESTYTCLYSHDSVLRDMRSNLKGEEGGDGGGGGGVEVKTEMTSMEDELISTNIETEAARRSVYASALLLVKLSEAVRTIVQHADIYEVRALTSLYPPPSPA